MDCHTSKNTWYLRMCPASKIVVHMTYTYIYIFIYEDLLPRFDINIIIVNWDSYTAFQGLYTTIITYPRLAEIVGRFVGNLTKAGADRKKVHIIGFSAGGEIAGLAGKTINPKVGRISGISFIYL